MRIDVFSESSRPWFVKLGLDLLKLWVGVYPGPPLALSFQPGFLHKDADNYIGWAQFSSGTWSKGEVELLGSFVSKLNSCHF